MKRIAALIVLLIGGVALSNYVIKKNDLVRGPGERPAASGQYDLTEDSIQTKQAAPLEVSE